MGNVSKEVKALLEQLESCKESGSSKARAIRRKLRSLGYYLSKGGAAKGKGKEAEDDDQDEEEDEKPVKKDKKAKKVKEDEEEENEDEDDE